jgi:hypothetical protein
MLHITNGDAPIPAMKAAGLSGEILPWRDVLHEGPVTSESPLESLSDLRARFIADCGWGQFEEVRRDFATRDSMLERYRDFEEVILWFEHDLYDQLQLLQLLAWFFIRDRGHTALSLVNVNEYLGPMEPQRFSQLFESRPAITERQLEIGQQGWSAFTSETPTDIEALLDNDTSALPFVAQALRRFLQQYPSTENGLSRSEHQALQAVADGKTVIKDAYVRSHHAMEEAVFLGDSTFAFYLAGLSNGSQPLVTLNGGAPVPGQGSHDTSFWNAELQLTLLGSEVLEKRADWIEINGIDRWYGGVHQKGSNARWRWDEGSGRLRGI